MNKETEHLETLTEIRSLMERSSRFISLSGLSGVCAGVFALAGAVAAFIYLDLDILSEDYHAHAFDGNGRLRPDFLTFAIINASCVLIGSLVAGSFFTIRKARLKGQTIWDKTAQRLGYQFSYTTGNRRCFLFAPASSPPYWFNCSGHTYLLRTCFNQCQ
jgi:hypothetical protein